MENITLLLPYTPPYLWQNVLTFLAERVLDGVEKVENGAYYRTVAVRSGGLEHVGFIAVSNMAEQAALRLVMSPSLGPVQQEVAQKAAFLFDTNQDPQTIYNALEKMNERRPGLARLGIRKPGCFDGFEMAFRTVLGQQITVKAARTLASRVILHYGRTVETGESGLTHLFLEHSDEVFNPHAIVENLGALGIIAARSRTIVAIIQEIMAGNISLSPQSNPQTEMAALQKIKGIGPWSANYLAMRAMGYSDGFVETDAVIKKALAPLSPREMLAFAEPFRPYRSYVCENLWATNSD